MFVRWREGEGERWDFLTHGVLEGASASESDFAWILRGFSIILYLPTMTFLKDTCLTYVWLLLQLDERLSGPQKFSKKKLFSFLSFDTHQNEIPTPKPIQNKLPLNMHVSIRKNLFIHINVFICTHIYVYVCISINRWIDWWIDGCLHTIQMLRVHAYVNTIQRSWIPGFASLSCYACTHAYTHACTNLHVYT